MKHQLNGVELLTLPNSKESEMMVLGCMLTSVNGLNVASETLDEKDFYYNEHKTIFRVLKAANKNDQPTDIHLVSEELKRASKLKNVGGVAYLTTLAQYAGTSVHIEEYCHILQRHSLSRKGVLIFEEAKRKLLEKPENPLETIENYNQQIVDIGKRYSPNSKTSIGEILCGSKSRIEPTPMLKRLKFRQNYYKEHGKSFITGLSTGFVELDNKVTILENTNLIVVAARPAMGKTACVLNILSHLCFKLHLPVGFISLEMGADQLVERLLSMKTKIPGEKIKRGTFTDEEYNKLQQENEELRKAKFFIHDQAVSSVSQVVSTSRRLKEEEDIKILAVDYIQLLETSNKRNDSRQYEVAEVSRTLKRLAMELKIPVIVIAQLSRKVEERTNKRPLMSDLRDSGQIEQDADAILFIYRDEYYNSSAENRGQAEIILSKNRHGPTTSVSLSFNSSCGTFGNSPSSDLIPKRHNHY